MSRHLYVCPGNQDDEGTPCCEAENCGDRIEAALDASLELRDRQDRYETSSWHALMAPP